jgi:Fe-S cluster assembly protein SufD
MTPVSITKPTKTAQQTRSGLRPFNFTRDQIPIVTDGVLHTYRSLAWEAYENLPFPTLKDEPWRRTDIRGLKTTQFILPEVDNPSDDQLLPLSCMNVMSKDEGIAGQIISGKTKPVREINPELVEKGVVFEHFHTAEIEHPGLLGKLLGQIVKPDEDKFTALAAALAQNGVLLYVPRGIVVELPFHSVYCGAGKDQAFLNHLVVWLEDGAQATFLHESTSPSEDGDGQLMHAGIVEIHVGQAAQLNFVELQSWGDHVWSFTRERAQVHQDGKLEWIVGATGTHLTKNFADIELVEPGAACRMSGFYFTNGNQHLDHDTQQNHLAKNTTSDLLFKGALVDKSRSVWQGMIYVAPGAVGTDGYQANRNLILSKGARADSIPGLEILADDVRCTHGATVGKIDENEMFYLLSRGIPRKEAERLIITGFFAPIMDRIPFEGVQNRLAQAIREKMADR